MHDMAFGAALPEEYIPLLEDHANVTLEEVDFGSSTVEVDLHSNTPLPNTVLAFGRASHLYGNGIPQPKFMFDLLITASDIQVMGKGQNTLKISRGGLEFIKFWATEDIEKLMSGNGMMKVRLVGRPDLNVFRGKESPQVKLEYIEILQEGVSLF